MLDYYTRQTLLETLIATYGMENQIQKAVESLTELSLALQKHLRAPGENDLRVLEELADVQIMLDQLRLLFCKDTPTLLTQLEEKKLERQQKRLRKAPPP